MRKKTLVLFAFLVVVFVLSQFLKFYRVNLASVPTAALPSKQNLSDGTNNSGFPLKLPKGFSLSTFVKDLGNPRVLAIDPDGTLVVSIPSQGKIVVISESVMSILDHLDRPHGIAFRCKEICQLFVAEEHAISSYDYDKFTKTAKNKKKILDLPFGGNHVTRTIGFGPDNKLYVSIGSSCNVCNEKESKRAAILSMNADGSDVTSFATGLRNSVFFVWGPLTNTMWATEMGRDLLGDDVPPDEINIVEKGKHYGWPYCYGKQIHDLDFDPKNLKADFCKAETMPSHIDLLAHSAPLGLAFIPKGSNWPEEYWGDLLVSYHGSWNRSTPTGYKVVRIKLDKDGNAAEIEDFISGWLQNKETLGRPVDLLFNSQGNPYVSDDKAGIIYEVRYTGR